MEVADEPVVLDPRHRRPQRFSISRPNGGQRFFTARLNASSYSSRGVLVERPRETVAHVGERLRRGLDDVDVVAVRLLGLVARRAIVLPLGGAAVRDQLRLVLGEDVELAGDHVGEAAAEDHTISSYTERCVRAAASHVSSSRARRAPARASSSASGSPSSSAIAAASAATSPAGTTRPAPNRQHRLGHAADVVGDRRHAGAERAEQRAALVELRPVREHGDRRLAEGAVDLGLRQVAEPPVDVESRRRGAVRLHRLERIARDDQPRVARPPHRLDRVAEALVRADHAEAEDGSPVVPPLRVAREHGVGDDAQPRRVVEEDGERVPAVEAVHDHAVEAGRGAAARDPAVRPSGAAAGRAR